MTWGRKPWAAGAAGVALALAAFGAVLTGPGTAVAANPPSLTLQGLLGTSVSFGGTCGAGPSPLTFSVSGILGSDPYYFPSLPPAPYPSGTFTESGSATVDPSNGPSGTVTAFTGTFSMLASDGTTITGSLSLDSPSQPGLCEDAFAYLDYTATITTPAGIVCTDTGTTGAEFATDFSFSPFYNFYNGGWSSTSLTCAAPLTVSKAGSGTGTVSSNPYGIICGPFCSSLFASGAPVTLRAIPGSGSTFAGWSGGGCSGTGSCVVTMNAAETVTATFDSLPTYALTVAKTGSGSGTVSSSPTGIACGSTCSHDYTSGTQVTLTAFPGPGSTFAGWSGGGCSGTGTCVVPMGSAQTVSASFSRVKAVPALSLAAPSGGIATVTLAASSVTATLTGGSAATGSVSFEVFGPSSSPPSSCASGGETVGSVNVSGNGEYHPPSGFKPSKAGTYWWYASYSGDDANGSASSACGATMPETSVVGQPVQGKASVVQPVKGHVTVNGVPLTGIERIPFGAIIDATHGVVKVTVRVNGKIEVAKMSKGVFRLTQGQDGFVTATLVHEDRSLCRARHVAALSKKPPKPRGKKKVLDQVLIDGHGKFRSKGKWAAAAAHGTRWLLADRCDGTRVHVYRDVVVVHDFARHRTIELRAGHSYLARPRRR
jgi:Divergent InlB B-repeat domain